MPFFDPLPPEPDLSVPVPTGWVPPAWDRPSEAILGAPVAISALLARTDQLALAFTHVEAYPNGFSFDVQIIGNPMTPRSLYERGPMAYGGMSRGPRIGLEFSDGRRAVESHHFPMPPRPGGVATLTFGAAAGFDPDGLPTGPVLRGQGGGGGGHHFAMRYWCYTLPSAGPMRLWTEWETRGFPETSVTVETDAIRDAAPRAVTLWEWTPES
jgi:hypothetical protein